MIPFISSHLIKMAADCSKIYNHAPPLLRAFNLSKQSFRLPHYNQDAIFSHRSSVMFTKSPSFPALSFLPKNSPFFPLPSMTSPVAGMISDEWRGHHSYFLDRVPAVAAEIPPTVHDSSLMQMWRETEVEGVADTPPLAEAEEPFDSSDACEEIMGIVPTTAALLPSPELSLTPSPIPENGKEKLNVRGREELEDFILKLEEECRREAAALAERHPVSQFPFRGRIQTLIRLRSLRQSATIIQQQWSQKLKAEIFEAESKNFSLRKTDEDESQCDINEVPIEESMTEMKVQPSNSLIYVLTITIDHSDIENSRLLELISTREIEYLPEAFHSLQAFYTSSSQYEDQHESQSLSYVWDERSLWGNSFDCQKPLDSHMLQTLFDGVSSDGTERSNEEQNMASDEGNWLLQPIYSWRGWWKKE